MIYKIKIKDKETGEEDFIIMGDSYKSFKEHLINVISFWTEKWHYEDESKHSKCFGRTISKEFIEVWYNKCEFVSFGGLKVCYEKDYDKKVEEHNQSTTYKPVKYLKDITWQLESQEFIRLLLKENRVINEEELKRLNETQGGLE